MDTDQRERTTPDIDGSHPLTHLKQDDTSSSIMTKQSTKKAKRRGGWPKRERAAVICRVHPDVSVWLDNMAAGSGRSKSAIVERWITSLCEIAGDAELDWQGNHDPAMDLPFLQQALVQAIIDLGLPCGWVTRIVARAIEDSAKGVRMSTEETLNYKKKRPQKKG